MIYLDNAATTMTDPLVVSAMLPYFTEKYGNPSSMYQAGSEVRYAIIHAREQVAKLIGASHAEVVFTSGGTESDNWVLTGFYNSRKSTGKVCIITSAFEHPAVLKTCEALKKDGCIIKYLPVSKEGYVCPDSLSEAISEAIDEAALNVLPENILVSVMYANNEIGTIQDIKRLAEITKAAGGFFHTDAVQAVGQVYVDVKDLGVDFLSASGHKFGGPKGIGFLYIKSGNDLSNLIYGGAQQNGRRGGTENAPGIVGLGLACEIAMNNLSENEEKVRSIRDRALEYLMENIPGSVINGALDKRLSGNISIAFPGIEASSLLIRLDMKGICVSSGSACAAGSAESSNVLIQIGATTEVLKSTIRITISHNNTFEEVMEAVLVIKNEVEALRTLTKKD